MYPRPCRRQWLRSPVLCSQSPRPHTIALDALSWDCPFESLSPTRRWPPGSGGGHSGACLCASGPACAQHTGAAAAQGKWASRWGSFCPRSSNPHPCAKEISLSLTLPWFAPCPLCWSMDPGRKGPPDRPILPPGDGGGGSPASTAVCWGQSPDPHS